jgi:hypothetical protein
MSQIKCALSLEKLEQLEKMINTKVEGITDPKVRQDTIISILKTLEKTYSGIVNQFQSYLDEKTANLKLSPDEATELNVLLDKALKPGKNTYQNLDSTERSRLFVLAEKAQNSLGGGNRVLIERAKMFVSMATSEKSEVTVEAITVLEHQRDVAQRNGDTKTVERIDKLIKSLHKSAKIASNLKIDWNAIEKHQNKRDRIFAELSLLEALKATGDGSYNKQVKKFEAELTRLRKELVNIRDAKQQVSNSDDDQASKNEQIEELDAQAAEIRDRLQKLNAKMLNGLDRKSKERLASIDAKIKQLHLELKKLDAENTDLDYVQSLIYSATPSQDWYLASARDLLQKTKTVRNNINFVKTTIEKTADDYQFTRQEVETLFGKEAAIISAVRAEFTESMKDPETKEPNKETKETISKEEVLRIFDIWQKLQEESIYDTSYQSEEGRIISDMVKHTDRQLITDVSPDDPQPVTRTREEALTQQPGYAYDGNKKEDRVKLVSDLQRTIGRLNTLSKLPKFNGLIPEWALVSALGTDAQSLFSLFEGALYDPQSVLYDDEFTFENDHQRRMALREMLLNYGFDENTFQRIPENREDFKSDFRNLIGLSFITDADGKIIGISKTVRVQSETKTITETHEFIESSEGPGKPLTQEEAKQFLSMVEEDMNNGFKVVTHGALQPDGNLEALILQAKDSKLGLRIGLRLHDTAMLGFKGAITTGFSRYNPPALDRMSMAYKSSSKPLPSEVETANAVADGNRTLYVEHAELNSAAPIMLLLAIQVKANETVMVENSSNVESEVYIEEATPLWMDGKTNQNPGKTNSSYNGVSSLFDIQVLSNLREYRGHGANRESMYDLSKVQSIASNLMFTAMEELNPNELNNILTGLVATPNQRDRSYELSMKLSQRNHAAYLKVKQQQREANGGLFIIKQSQDVTGEVTPLLNADSQVYVREAIKEVFETLRAYKRKPEKVIAQFALDIGFRKQEAGEKTGIYVRKLFEFANKTFNGQEYSFVDFGNGKFDYISSTQLGRGFAQVMLGFVREGNTLTQNIDFPLTTSALLKEERATDSQELDILDIENNIEERQYLPLTRQNVSFFAPLSMYEQERTYSDWALRQRYQHILTKDLSDEDRTRFMEFIKTNRIVEFKNKILELKNEIEKNKDNPTKLKEIEQELFTVKEEFSKYMETLDDRRLEQGRVQLFNLINPVNNKDLFTSIPTMEESIQMSLEVAAELPQLIATYVHDSRNYIPGSNTQLENNTYMVDPGKSAGGSGAQATWSGIHPLLGFMVMYPQKFRPTEAQLQEYLREAKASGNKELVKRYEDMISGKDKYGIVDITPEILKQALEEGAKARREGVNYSKSSYFDDKFSGIHHLVAAQEAFFPSTRKRSLLNELFTLLNNGMTVTEDQLVDYYSKTFDETLSNAELLKDKIRNNKDSSQQKTKKLQQLDKILAILSKNQLSTGDGPNSDARAFFKGVVIPIIYSGGFSAVAKDLKNRRKKANKTGDVNNPDIGDLSDSDIELLAWLLTSAAGKQNGRLIDQILDLDASKSQELVKLMTGDTEELVSKYKLDMTNLSKLHPEMTNAMITQNVLHGAIRARIEYVARLSIQPSDIQLRLENKTLEETGLTKEQVTEQLVKEKTDQLLKKWKTRIDKAIARLEEYNQFQGKPKEAPYKLGSEIDNEINIILAGGQKQYAAQATLLFLNKVQNSGYSLNTTNQALLGHQVQTGRYIAQDDLMFQNYVVFMSAGIGTTTGRMYYPGNYLTNLHGTDLSKGLRLVYNDDGSLDMGDTTLGSMWTLTENPLGSMTRENAIKKAQDLAIRQYSLMLATDYDPEFLGYNASETESRENFFKAWESRSQEERTFSHRVKRGGDLREAYKKVYQDQQRMVYRSSTKADGSKYTEEEIERFVVDISEKDIDDAIESNSVPFHKRETLRVLAPDVLLREEGVMMTMKDAKGLGGFIPRIADHDFNDAIVHGLYSIHHQSRQMRTKAGRNLFNIRKVQQEKPSLSQVLTEKASTSSIYDPDQVAYIPVTADSLPEMMLDHEPTMLVKTANMQNTLDMFAIEYGYDQLMKDRDYARLYLIYQIHNKLRKLTRRLHSFVLDSVQEKALRMEHRNLVLDLFKLTKFQRDAKGSERSILSFQKAITVDPTKFKTKSGKNMLYLDAMRVLAQLGITELHTLKFGISPTQLQVLGDQSVDVLKNAETIVKPYYVQGHDVALLIMEVLANDVVKRRATEIAKDYVKKGKITSISTDPQGFVILSDLNPELNAEILQAVLKDDALLDSAANNLNLYVTLEWGSNVTKTNPDGSPRVKITAHNPSTTAMVMTRRGVGDVIVNRTRQGPQQAHFMLTAEDLKRILVSSENNGLWTKVELAVQTNKYLGSRTNVDTLRSQSFIDFAQTLKQDVAEEVEILQRLQNPDKPLRLLVTTGQSELKDEHGLTLNPFDSEYYFYETGEETETTPANPEYKNLNPFKVAISSRISKAIKLGQRYVTLKKETQILEEFYNGLTPNFVPVSYLIFLKSNAKDLGMGAYKVLVEEVMGVDTLSQEDFEKIYYEAEELLGIIEKIEFSPTKGKNPYLSVALKTLEQKEGVGVKDIPTISNPSYTVKPGRHFRTVRSMGTTPSSYSTDVDFELKALAIEEAKSLLRRQKAFEVPAYPALSHQDIITGAYHPEHYDTVIPGDDGNVILNQIDNLVANKTISEETAVFYRYMVASIFKSNPNLVPLLSITAIDTSSNIAGSAIKQEDKFVIRLNTNILKNMGTVDQVRVFAHEVAHIARMAFIRDNSSEWNRIISIFNSKNGKATIETMLLAMNNGKKYIGFDDDVQHYLSHPEEFAAQWGAWVLVQKTFNNTELMKFLQSRNRGSVEANNKWKAALFAVQDELIGIGIGLSELDEKLRNDLFEVVDSMFGFTATEARQIYVSNKNQELFMVSNLLEPLSSTEETELNTLSAMRVRTKPDEDRFLELQRRNEAYGVNLDKSEYITLRNNRMSAPDFRPTTTNEELEIIQTVVNRGLEKAAVNARADHTIGGLTRNMAEKIFGVETANKIVSARRAMVWGTQAGSTYDNSDPIIATLMNIISDTMSVHSYQFQYTEGSQSIIPNRLYTRRMVERVSYETDQLHLESSNTAEFLALREWAAKEALGVSQPTPRVSDPKVLTAARNLALAMNTSSTELRDFIQGSYGRFNETIPMQWETDLLGTGSKKTLSGASSSTAKQNQARDRQLVQAELSQMIRNRLLKGEGIDSTVIYTMGLLPKVVTRDSILELSNRHPSIVFAFKNIVKEELAASGSYTIAQAQIIVDAMFDPLNNFTAPPGIGITTEDFVRVFADITKQAYGRAAIGKLQGSQFGKIHDEIAKVVISTIDTDVATLGELTTSEKQQDVPPSVLRIQEVSAFSGVTLSGKPSDVLAKLFMGHVGNSAKYMSKSGFMNMKLILENPKISKFVDTSVNKGMYQIERTQGYMKTSERSIERITGVENVNIAKLISLIRKNINSIKTDDKPGLLRVLSVLEEKIKIDQGLGIKEIGAHPVFEFIAKWGPDITRVAHGNNLNTASLLVEGGIGFVINSMYGGNPLRFANTIFGTMWDSYWGRGILKRGMTQVEQRGAAVNLLLGVERMIQDAREVVHIADTRFDKNASKIQKIRDWIRQSNNRGLTSVQVGLSEQAQWIVKKNLLNGNLLKLKDIVENGYGPTKKKVTNMTELKEALGQAGVARFGTNALNSHMAWIIIQSGLLNTKVLDAYRYMNTVVDNTNTEKWGLDLQAAGRWIDRTTWKSGEYITGTGQKIDNRAAKKAIESIYFINKEYTNIVTVDPNSFDSATSTNALETMFFFYRQYPNLFLAQKVFRLAGRMDKSTWLALMVSSSILDMIYNMLLLVAAGALPLTALAPWSDEFIFKKQPYSVIKTLFTRNPIFSPVGNLVAESVYSAVNAAEKTKINKYQNRYTQTQKGFQAFYQELMPDFVPLSAAETLLGGMVPSAVLGANSILDVLFLDGVGGELNTQERWDRNNALIRVGARLTPGVELWMRALLPTLGEELMGKRPVRLPVAPVGSSPFAQPGKPLSGLQPTTPKQSPNAAVIQKKTLESSLKPIPVPKGLR